MVWGLVTSETPDHEKEICDYPTAKKSIKEWSDDQLAKTVAAGQDPSLGNMRVMHQLTIGGKAFKIEYKDDVKQVWVGSEPANDEVWHLLKGGFLTCHSIGGGYLWKKAEGEYVRYGPSISEISYVDKGANPDSAFSYVKADGTTELRKFAKPGPEEEALLKKIKSSEMASLSDVDIDRIVKALSASLNTTLTKKNQEKNDSGQYSATGATMNELIKKCAVALGISEEELLTKLYPVDNLEKGKGGLAALHAHLKKAIAHHGKMEQHQAKIAEMVKAHGEMHGQMADHLENCMKAHGACTDSAEAEKVLKALIAAEKTEEVVTTNNTGGISEEKVAEMITKAVTEALSKQPVKTGDGQGVQLFRVSREEVAKAQSDNGASPDPFGGV